jgi:UDP-N-acetylglucosamine 2-epimerase (non-hydrolysing)
VKRLPSAREECDLLVVVGARPNFMKAASIVEAAMRADVSCSLVHTGQHYDEALSDVFFEELGLPEPDAWLEVGSGTHAGQTAAIMLAFERVLDHARPKIVVVVGDVNSTLACSLVATKQRYPVAHVEAGLRCFDRWMPEEINRKLTDHLATHLFTTSRDANRNLLAEGIDPQRIALVGNTMIDTLLRFADAARARSVPARVAVGGRPYAVATLHRVDNVDDPCSLRALVGALLAVSCELPVVFPIHPRTRRQLVASKLEQLVLNAPNLIAIDPISYLDFIGLVTGASLVLTDSGGVQEETTVLGVPCLTLRPSTERPVTVELGTNRVVGTDPRTILAAARDALRVGVVRRDPPELWDGRAGERIIERLRGRLDGADAIDQSPVSMGGFLAAASAR